MISAPRRSPSPCLSSSLRLVTSNRFSVLEPDIPAPSAENVLEENPVEQINVVHRQPRERKLRTTTIGNGARSLIIPIQAKTLDTGQACKVQALIDSGATGSFIDTTFLKSQHWNTRELEFPISVINVDGTTNSSGKITEAIDLTITFEEHREKMTFCVVDLGKNQMILGHDWLKRHNPVIDWVKGKIEFKHCPAPCHQSRKKPPTIMEDDEPEEEVPTEVIRNLITEEDDDRVFVTRIYASETISQRLYREATPEEEMRRAGLVPDEYKEFASVFEKSSFDQLPPRRPWDHAIELKDDFKEKFSKVYPLNPKEQVQLDEFIKENLDTGRIRPSKSPMASPVFFIKKKDGSLRLVQDYRALNEMTIKNRYPLPLISELLDKLKKAKYFTALDVRWGYNNIRIKEGDEWKAAFRTNRGLFEPTVMFFGLTNSPATFQAMMNEIFRELISEGVVVVYLDDILIFTETMEEHIKIVRRVLQILKDNNLYLKPEKCHFHRTELDYLGYKISHDTVAMDPIKVKGVVEWPVPKNKKELQSFLGFVNYYRRFIRDFSELAHPLHRLTGSEDWQWETEQQEAFEALKRVITEAPVLRMPNDEGQYRVEADSSDFATGAVLSQYQDGDWHPIAFQSKSLSDAERNYDIFDKELLAIIRALDKWRHYLEGALHRFEIWTDHKNLEYFRTAQKLNRRQSRWSLFLSSYDFDLHHRPGKSHGKTDALSRRADHVPEGEDNKDIVLLKPEWLAKIAAIRGHAEVEGVGNDLMTEIAQEEMREESVIKALGRRDPRWESKEDNVLLYNGLVYVPPKDTLRRKVLDAHHDTPFAGHPGQAKTLELITRNYWWPSIKKDVQHYVQTCVVCQRTKTFPAKPSGFLQPNRIPSQPWEEISIDLISGLPESNTCNAIVVIVDRFSKMIHVTPTTDKISSEGIARIYRDNIWKLHGIPTRIISDRGSIFISQFMDALHELIGSKAAPSTAFHPQTDGQTERVNQEVELFLRMFINDDQDDWSDWLPIAEFVHNNRVHSATGFSPFLLNYGHNPRSLPDPPQTTHVESANVFVERMRKMRETAKTALEKAAADMKKFYDRRRAPVPQYKVGDKVWLDGSNITSSHSSKKLDDKRYGPFIIEQLLPPNAVRLKLPASLHIHPVFNVVKILPFHEDTNMHPVEKTRPPPAISQGIERYEVEFLRDIKPKGNGFVYLVHWKNYPNEDDSWVAASELRRNAPKTVHEFHKKYPNKPRPLTAIQFAQIPFREMPPAITDLDISYPDGIYLEHVPRSAHLKGGG